MISVTRMDQQPDSPKITRILARLKGRLRSLRRWWGGAILVFLAFLVMDALFPLPLPEERRDFAAVVADREGNPLRAFPDEEGVWRYPIREEEVSPLYLEALFAYEDRWFYRHPGVNPFSLARGLSQAIWYRRPISGGSTLTMQVARILDPHSRTFRGKLWQIFRAFQLEWHLSKKEILALYLNRAPMGGPLEGVAAASYAYLGKHPSHLSPGEAALLAVLPQAPTRLRPDRHPERAEKARNKVIDRLHKFGIWDDLRVEGGKRESVVAWFRPHPLSAPLLARRLKEEARRQGRLTTTIDAALQWLLEDRLQGHLARMPERSSIAALIVENEGLAIRAYAGSADFFDDARFGHVDMVRAVRSPGSTLKPFLYGFALEDGLIHSESLLVDAPQDFDGYRPGNFEGRFHGPVSAMEALRRSLNVPAVDLLRHLTPERFTARLRQAGLTLHFPAGGKPNLAVILGGAGVTLEGLVEIYAGLGRDGVSGTLRFSEEDPVVERRLMSPGAAWIVRQMLAAPRPGFADTWRENAQSRRLSWKTGTSYGFRDAWAMGVTDRYTIGVWTGRPDGHPVPGHYGAVTAAPILFDLAAAIPARMLWHPVNEQPPSVSEKKICWPLGEPPRGEGDPLCHEERTAWVLDGLTPPTFADSGAQVVHYWVDAQNGRRVDARCEVHRRLPRAAARWPIRTYPWLSAELLGKQRIPKAHASCPGVMGEEGEGLLMAGINDGDTLSRAGPTGQDPVLSLTALGAEDTLFWLVNGVLMADSAPQATFRHRFTRPGSYRLTVMERSGRFDSKQVTVVE